MNVLPLVRRFAIGSIFASLVLQASADSKDSKKTPPISNQSRVQIIRLLNAEYVWVRKSFPMGEKGLTVTPNGEIAPGDSELRQLVAKYGEAAKPGQRAQITNVEFKGSGIRFEINGGPKKKAKWYQRIQVGGNGGMTPVSPQDPNEAVAKGSYVVLDFKGYIPEISLTEIKEILKPVLDFTVKSAAQAYTESLPENVRNAIRDHKALVGMNKEMVTYAKGRPPQRIRERDGNKEYEEWIFGTPPEDVDFVRFVGDECIQVKTMKVDGEKIVRTQKEVQLEDMHRTAPVDSIDTASKDNAPPKPKPVGAPTLRRPGDPVPDDPTPSSPNRVPVYGAPGSPGSNPPNQPPNQAPNGPGL